MPIPKRSSRKLDSNSSTITTEKISIESNYDSNISNWYDKPQKKGTPWCLKIGLIIFWIYIVICIIAGIVNDSWSSKSSSSYKSNTTSTSTNTNNYEKDWYCKWSDWNWYTKPVHWYCDWGKTPLWRKCNAWYTAKSENNKTRINSSRYCAANCSNFTCYENYNCVVQELQIPKSVNQYSQSSVDNYNAKIEAYNRCLSERCYCR